MRRYDSYSFLANSSTMVDLPIRLAPSIRRAVSPLRSVFHLSISWYTFLLKNDGFLHISLIINELCAQKYIFCRNPRNVFAAFCRKPRNFSICMFVCFLPISFSSKFGIYDECYYRERCSPVWSLRTSMLPYERNEEANITNVPLYLLFALQGELE